MSGHNKWSTIKHKKGAADAKRGKLFSRLVKESPTFVQSGHATQAGKSIPTAFAPRLDHRGLRHGRRQGTTPRSISSNIQSVIRSYAFRFAMIFSLFRGRGR